MSNPMSPISPTSPYPAIPSIVVPERSPVNSQPPRMQRGHDLGHRGALSARSFQDSSPGGTGKPLSAISTNSQTYPPSPVYATPPTSPLPPAPPAPSRILFYDKDRPYYGFTNFSAHPVVYEGRTYPTSEHLFQSFKFHGHRPGLAMHIQTCGPSARTAFQEARNFQPEARKDWFRVNLAKMDETLWLKFTQHEDLKEQLLATGEAELVEDSPYDSFWGIGPDGKGENNLGKALVKLRTELRKRADPPSTAPIPHFT